MASYMPMPRFRVIAITLYEVQPLDILNYRERGPDTGWDNRVYFNFGIDTLALGQTSTCLKSSQCYGVSE